MMISGETTLSAVRKARGRKLEARRELSPMFMMNFELLKPEGLILL